MATSSKKSATKTVKAPKKPAAATQKNSNGTGKISSDTLHEALQEHFGFDKFKGNQEPIIKNLLAGKDTFVIKPTGGGKSLCYQLPAILSEGVAIIVSPLIALMKNQVDLVDRKSTRLNSSHD